jgi:hypothetical protein
MTLATEVQARVPSAVLVALTNPRSPDATSINSTTLAQACTSIEAFLGTYAQETYDGTVPIHLEVAIKGVVGLLRLWGAGYYEGDKAFWEDFKSDCEAIAKTRARARITPTTNSDLTPSDENATGAEMRPWADDSGYRALLPRRVGSDTDEDGG